MVERVTELLFRLLYLPFEILDRLQDEPAIAAAAAVALAFGLWALWRYQRCPHCRRFVRRARGGWLRCPRCGRQYHHGFRVVR
jgi:hypothetical protein